MYIRNCGHCRRFANNGAANSALVKASPSLPINGHFCADFTGALVTLIVIVRVLIAISMAFEYVQVYDEAEATSEAFRIRNGQINSEATLQSFLWPFMGGSCFTSDSEICEEAKRQSINLWRFPPGFDEILFMWFWPMISASISFALGWTLTANYPLKSSKSN